MSETSRPEVLIVDDHPDDRSSFAQNLEQYLNVEVAHPNDVTAHQVSGSHLVMVDYFLDDWCERDRLKQDSLKPLNGVALTGILRAHAEQDEQNHSPAFSLISGRPEGLSPDFPPEYRPHILAQKNGFEWVFFKGRSKENLARIVALALAMMNLPRAWKHKDSEHTHRQLKELLKLREGMPGSALAFEDVERCHPPIHEFSETSHGLSIIRWLLHRILPHPTFLWDERHLAARLRLKPASLTKAMDDGRPLREVLRSVEYSGALANFLGPRWWRSGVEAWIWQISEGQPHRPEKLLDALTELGVEDLEPVPSQCELVCLGSDYQVRDGLYRMDDAVRIQPDPWPPYADQAWALIEDVEEDPALRALVIQDDLERLL